MPCSASVFRWLFVSSLLATVSSVAWGQSPPPGTPPALPPTETEKEVETTETAGEAQDPEVPSQESGQDEKQAEKKKADAPPESGDDVAGQLDDSDKARGDGDDKETDAAVIEPPAEEVESPIEKVVNEDQEESGDNIGGKLEEVKEGYAGILERGFISDIYRLWRPLRDQLQKDTGLNVGLAYTTLLQAATGGEDPREGWSGDFDFFGKWYLVNRGQSHTGSVGFMVEQRHRFSEITPHALNDNLGGLWRTTKGFNVQDWALAQVWWEQFLFEDHVRVTAGKLDAANYYNGNRFQSQNTFFLSQAFSTNPARAFPDNGLGVNVRIAPSDALYFSFGVHDTNNNKNTSGFNNLDKDDLFYAVEVGFTPHIEGRGPGRYRFTGWYTGAGERTNGESGAGFALSFEQDLGNDLVPFIRYGYQDRDLVDTKQILAGGLGILKPFGRERDVFGLGLAWGQPEDSSFRDQYVTELFYRFQVSSKIQITPGFQVIFDPSKNLDDDVIGIFEFRVRVVF